MTVPFRANDMNRCRAVPQCAAKSLSLGTTVVRGECRTRRPASPPPPPPRSPRLTTHLAFSKRQHDPISLERSKQAILPHRPLRGHLAAAAHELPPGKPPCPNPPSFRHQLHQLSFPAVLSHLLQGRSIYDRYRCSGRRKTSSGSARSDCLGARSVLGRRHRPRGPALF